MSDNARPGIKSFARRGARMSRAQERSYNELSARFCVTATGAPLNFSEIFGNTNNVICEIGFGMGSATAAIAGANPNINYIGIEVYKAGIGRLLWEIERLSLNNIRIIEGDAVETLASSVADKSIAAFHIFFPDPWPKKRHRKRRLVQRPFTDMLAKKLIPEGYVFMATDWEDYAESALAELCATPALTNKFSGFADKAAWRPVTKFERKGIAKSHKIFELYFTSG